MFGFMGCFYLRELLTTYKHPEKKEMVTTISKDVWGGEIEDFFEQRFCFKIFVHFCSHLFILSINVGT